MTPRLPPVLEALADGGALSGSDDDGLPGSPGADWVDEEGERSTPPPPWAALAAAAPPAPPIDGQVASPALSPAAAAAFAALRAALATGERSTRVHALTTHILTTLNAADYTAWAVRWECCAGADGVSSPRAEAAFVDALAAAGGAGAGGLKVYQVWRYRARLATEGLRAGGGGEPAPPDPATLARERAFAGVALARDAKHYHAWAHRAALAGAAGAGAWWPAEADVAAAALAEDPLNNSAWAHRAAAVGAAVRGGLLAPPSAADAEFALAAAAIRADPANESAWAHVRCAADIADGGRGGALARDAQFAGLAVEVLAGHPGCVPALVLLHEAHAARVVVVSEGGGGGEDVEASRAAAAECRRRLAAADPGRAGLWAALGKGL